MPQISALFDTNVLIKVFLHAFILPDKTPYTEIYNAIMAGVIIPVYSRPTMDELLRKLTRPNELTKRFKIIPADAQEFVEGIFYGLGDFVDGVEGVDGECSDPGDWMFEEAAALGGSDYARPQFLVTDDNDLHEEPVVKKLAKLGVEVVYSHNFAVRALGVTL